jgi:FkbM family methyltransferase
MTFISYAQNFEDVILQRVLKNISNGFYIDIGAWSPDVDSITKSFYFKNWTGINVEPNPKFHKELLEKRPRDTNLCVAVSDTEGSAKMTFLEGHGSGMSTLDKKTALMHSRNGWKSTTQTVRIISLKTIFKEYIPRNKKVHFLKIDVEGLEKKVLAGNDWKKNRPWVVLIEATVPGKNKMSFSDWEPILTKANYSFVYTDGLNRFYLAKEKKELISKFDYPPNIFDDFIQYRTFFAEDQLRILNQRIIQVVNNLESIKNSSSWRITKPLREFKNIYLNLFSGKQ